MKSLKLAFLYAFLLWLVPFVVSIAIFPIKKPEPFLFQSLMTVIAALTVVVLTVFYFKKTQRNLAEGIFLGILFVAFSLFFDFFFFIWGPIKMPIPQYIKEIAVNYLVYPIVTIGFSFNPHKTEAS